MDLVNQPNAPALRKLELVVADSFLAPALLELEAAGISGSTVLQVVQSKGLRSGEVLYDGLLPGSSNLWVFAVAPAAAVQQAFDRLKPLIDQWGGLLIVCDVYTGYGPGLK